MKKLFIIINLFSLLSLNTRLFPLKISNIEIQPFIKAFHPDINIRLLSTEYYSTCLNYLPRKNIYIQSNFKKQIKKIFITGRLSSFFNFQWLRNINGEKIGLLMNYMFYHSEGIIFPVIQKKYIKFNAKAFIELRITKGIKPIDTGIYTGTSVYISLFKRIFFYDEFSGFGMNFISSKASFNTFRNLFILTGYPIMNILAFSFSIDYRLLNKTGIGGDVILGFNREGHRQNYSKNEILVFFSSNHYQVGFKYFISGGFLIKFKIDFGIAFMNKKRLRKLDLSLLVNIHSVLGTFFSLSAVTYF